MFYSEFMEVFSLYDKDEDGTIVAKNVGDVMRALGENPGNADLKKMLKEVDESIGGNIDFLHLHCTLVM